MVSVKKFLSILLAILLVVATTVTAFASNDGLQEEIIYSYQIEGLIDNYILHFINSDGIIPPGLPEWSASSRKNLESVCSYVEEKLKEDNLTQDELKSLKDMVESAADNMCIDSSELKWMLDYMEKDYNSTGYYDEETMSNIKEIYEKALSAYYSGDESQIHISYVNMRNELNKLCRYNQVQGDINLNGKLDIDDITLMQKDLACLTKLNSSQMFIASYNNHDTSVKTVTMWQTILVGDSYSTNVKTD